ncbi:MAG: ABC transporter ATP-binding protein [Gemmatimonadota bacterium]
MSAAPEVRVEGLTKRFGRLQALRGIDLTIAAGRITAVLGPNAAGKTTVIKAVLGLVRLDRHGGRILIDGEPIASGYRYRERIGYMPQAAQFPEYLTGREVINLLRDLRGRPADLDEELLERFALGPALEKPIRTLSGGTRQKINAIVAFLFRPSLLILDEPTAGLDPIASGVLKDKVQRAPSEGKTVLVTSHVLSEVEEMAQDIVFLIEGRVEFTGTLASLIETTGEPKLERAIARLLARRAA